MTKKTKMVEKHAKNAIQTYSYANVYAIQTSPLTYDEEGVEVIKWLYSNSSGKMIFKSRRKCVIFARTTRPNTAFALLWRMRPVGCPAAQTTHFH